MRSLAFATLSLIAVVSAISVPQTLQSRQTVANCDLEACVVDIASAPGAAATCAEGDPTAAASCLVAAFPDCTACDPTGLITFLTGLIPAGTATGG